MALYALGNVCPDVPDSAYIAESSTVIGRVSIGQHASIWPQAVVRADNEPMTIGDRSNIQDGAVLHSDPGYPLSIGANVSVGHQAMLHGCTIGEGSLVGIQAVILNGAVIGRNCLVAAGAVVTEGKIFEDNSLILGAPAKAVRQLTESQIAGLTENADGYVRRSAQYRKLLTRIV